MGRLTDRRVVRWLTLATLLAYPLVALLPPPTGNVDHHPMATFGIAVHVAYLLCVGPRGAPVVLVGAAVGGLVLGPADGLVPVLAMALVETVVVLALVRLLERRFAHHGPVRSRQVIIEYALIAGAALPFTVHFAHVAVLHALGGPAHGAVTGPSLAAGIGVLTLTVAVRMVVKGQHRQLPQPALRGVLVAIPASVLGWTSVLLLLGPEAVVSSQYIALPVMVLALVVGTVAYSLAAGAATFAIVAVTRLLGAGPELVVSVQDHVLWWVVAAAGLLLAVDGDRRRAAAEEFRSFFLRSATPSLSVNAATGEVLRANEAAGRLLRRPHASLVGQPALELVAAPEARGALAGVLAGDTEERTVDFAEAVSPTADARWLRMEVVHVALGGPQHDVVHVQFVDLTAERARAVALERSNTALERLGRRVAHDLKQPMVAIAGYASTLRELGDGMDEQMVSMMHERMEAAAMRAIDQLDETFTSAASIGDGRTDVHLHELVASVVSVLDIDLAEVRGVVDTALAAAHVNAESGVVRAILLNLLTNSLKYARDDRAPRIRVSSRVVGDGVEITVTDNGSGISAEHLEDVFRPGVRLDPARADGRGRGLADSRDLAEAAGGSLRAEPWPDGARFVLWLPDESVEGTGGRTSVLLVEDDPVELARLRQRLGSNPQVDVVGTAGSLRDAVAAARTLRPDVVLLDRWLGDGDGLDGVIALARAHRDARIVLLTGGTIDVTDDVARTAGIVRTVDRDVPDADLVAQVLGSR